MVQDSIAFCLVSWYHTDALQAPAKKILQERAENIDNCPPDEQHR